MTHTFRCLAAGIVALLFANLSGGNAAAQTEQPDVPKTAFRTIDFVPPGWKLFDKVEGDLNADGLTDAVLVIQRNDPAGIVANPDGLGVDRYENNQRVLLVAMQAEGQGFVLAGQDSQIIPNWDSPTIGDPYSSITIRDRKLVLSLEFFANAGSWLMFNQQFQFRLLDGKFALIGYEYNSVRRNTGEANAISINFLTGRRKDSSGNISTDVTNDSWSNIPANTRPNLGEIGNGFEFER